jgi:hypothetical protein
MRLYATMTSDRGKPVSKASNEIICVQFTKDMCQKFSIMFDGNCIQVLNYNKGDITTLEYHETYREEGKM